MKKFGCGIGVAVVALAIVAGIWFSLDEQARGIVVGLLLGGVGMLIGVILALAVVAIFLLYNLNWHVRSGGQPVMHGPGQQAALPAPDPQFSYYPPQAPPWSRPARSWRGLGAEDMPPGTRPMFDPLARPMDGE